MPIYGSSLSRFQQFQNSFKEFENNLGTIDWHKNKNYKYDWKRSNRLKFSTQISFSRNFIVYIKLLLIFTLTGQLLSTNLVSWAVPSWNDLWYFFGPLPSVFFGGPKEPPQIRAIGSGFEVTVNPPRGIGPGKMWSLSKPQCSSYSMCERVIFT